MDIGAENKWVNVYCNYPMPQWYQVMRSQKEKANFICNFQLHVWAIYSSFLLHQISWNFTLWNEDIRKKTFPKLGWNLLQVLGFVLGFCCVGDPLLSLGDPKRKKTFGIAMKNLKTNMEPNKKGPCGRWCSFEKFRWFLGSLVLIFQGVSGKIFLIVPSSWTDLFICSLSWQS